MVAHVAQCHIVPGREIQIVADYGAASSSPGKASKRGNAGEGCRDDAQIRFATSIGQAYISGSLAHSCANVVLARDVNELPRIVAVESFVTHRRLTIGITGRYLYDLQILCEISLDLIV